MDRNNLLRVSVHITVFALLNEGIKIPKERERERKKTIGGIKYERNRERVEKGKRGIE